MSRKATLIYSEEAASFGFGIAHPLKPQRLRKTYELLEAYDLFSQPGISVEKPEPVSEEVLLAVHTKEYVRAVRALSRGSYVHAPWRYRLGTSANPIVKGMYEAAAWAVGGSILAAHLVFERKTHAAFNILGGLHHAHPNYASGFCLFNDPALAIHELLSLSDSDARIAYIDIDAHHGDGVQKIFYDSPKVLTISVHESGRYLFPGTGSCDEIGEGEGRGYSVNIPLAPFTDDETYLWAFREVVPPLINSFGPHFVVAQLGADSHYRDPLTHLSLTIAGYAQVVREVKRLAGGKLVAMGGGGYDQDVVPRAWALAFGIMAGVRLPEELPDSQKENFRSAGGKLNDSVSPSLPWTDVRRVRHFASESVDSVKKNIFPFHGL
jgi:acetoin utilization protein AcuC